MNTRDLGDLLQVMSKPVTKTVGITEEERNEIDSLRREITTLTKHFTYFWPKRVTAENGVITADMVGGRIVDFKYRDCGDCDNDYEVELPLSEKQKEQQEINNQLNRRIEEIKERIKHLNRAPITIVDTEATAERQKNAEQIKRILQERKRKQKTNHKIG